MKYRLIALNIEALWDNNYQLSEANRQALIDVQERDGVRVVLVGRYPLSTMMPWAEQIELERYSGYIVSSSGATLTNCQSHRTLSKATLPSELCSELYSFLPDELFMVAYNSHEAIVWGSPAEEIERYIPSCLSLKHRCAQNPLLQSEPSVQKIEIYAPEDEQRRIEKIVQAHWGTLTRTLRRGEFLEILPATSHIATSLQYLLEGLDYSMASLIAVGVCDTDVEMMQAAGLGVAVANAPEAVKACADYITTDSATDSIAHLIQKHIRPQWQSVGFSPEDANAIMPNTLMASLGICCTQIAKGYVEATMPVDHRTRQPLGILHGGASLALAETVAGLGSVALLQEGEMQVGVQVSGYHVASTLEGDTVRAEARIMHQGKSTHVWNIDIFSTQSNKLICTCRVLNSILKRR